MSRLTSFPELAPVRALRWRKLGLVIRPTGQDWMVTHAMLPTVERRSGDVYRVYFSGRDRQNRSHIAYAEIDLNKPTAILRYSDYPVLGLGDLGCFDDNGVTPSWLVQVNERRYLYYVGWNKGSTVRMHLFGGLALSDDGGETFARYSRAPILERTPEDPLLNTAPCVLREADRWRMWYVSGVEWVDPDTPRYHIKYAESQDGLAWRRGGVVAIDFQSPQEAALARPCVLKDLDGYRMWFSFKEAGGAYRIGYAESSNGTTWTRLDHLVGISTSSDGWDSSMIAYACVFDHHGTKFMLYNGNDYGREGAGLAIAEPG